MTHPSPTARERLRADLARYGPYRTGSFRRRLTTVLGTEALWVIILFRFGQYLFQEAPTVLQRVLGLPYRLVMKFVQLITGIHLDPETKVGPGLYIGHHGGIWIHWGATIGANCNISQGVTIGRAGLAGRAVPVLGDRVWVGPNAVITAPARVGSGAVVGANSLVVMNVPENGVAVGVPARVMSYSGSAHLINLPKASGADAGAALPQKPSPPSPGE